MKPRSAQPKFPACVVMKYPRAYLPRRARIEAMARCVEIRRMIAPLAWDPCKSSLVPPTGQIRVPRALFFLRKSRVIIHLLDEFDL
jgi:hypothetical protein